MARIVSNGPDRILDPGAWEKAAETILQNQAITLSAYWERMIRAFSKHGLEQAVKAKSPRRYANGELAAYVTFSGTRPNGNGSRGGKNRTVRNAAIAFYNEYGTERVPRRLWMRAANAAAEAELAEIAKRSL